MAMRSLIKPIAFLVISLAGTVSVQALNKTNNMVPTSSIHGLSSTLSYLQKHSDLPVVFPQVMPKPVNDTEYYAYLEPAQINYNHGYQIDIDTTADCHGVKVCNVGSFSLQQGAKISLQQDMNNKNITVQIKTPMHAMLYFTPSHAMGDYWPAMIQWVDNGVLFNIAWKAPKVKTEQNQLMQMANTIIVPEIH